MWREKNRDKINYKKRLYREKNREKLNNQRNERRNKRRKEDSSFRLIEKIRIIIYKSLKKQGFKKKSKTHEILGCSFEEFKIHLESKFEPWMTWENRGLYNGEFNHGWDIDHIIPLNSAKTEDDVIRLNHHTNLQPLCSKINRDIKNQKY